MTDEAQRHDTRHNEAAIAGTAAKVKDQDNEARVGKYGGDDGALEHENTEIETPQDPNSKTAPGSKPKA